MVFRIISDHFPKKILIGLSSQQKYNYFFCEVETEFFSIIASTVFGWNNLL